MKTTSYLLAMVMALGLSASAYAQGKEFSATLNGAQQVRTADILDAGGNTVTIPIQGAVVTGAYGQAHFRLLPNGTMLHYEFEATGFASPMFMAHIHLGPKGANGGVLFWLFGDASIATTSPRDDGPFTGSISGVLTADDLNPMPGLGINTFEDAVANIMNGNTYVNLHTLDNGGGEIRGQIHLDDDDDDDSTGPPFGNNFPFGRGNSPFGPGFPFNR